MTISSESVTQQSPFTPPSPNRREIDSRHAKPPAKESHHLLTNKFINHHPKYGLNPLVDAAAYLFSIIGKLKQIKSYRHLTKLQKELIHEINHFQESAKTQGYSSEYILVTRYALCATLDDVIANTLWGGQGQWDNYSMLTVFNQDSMNHERFFAVLERIIKDPGQYIDVMEFMYICLSLGFKGNYRSEFGNTQLEQITHSLYRRIRRFRGDYSKSLAPFPIKISPKKSLTLAERIPLWSIIGTTFLLIFVLFLCLGYMLDSLSKEAHQELMQIGNSLSYETNHS